MGTFFISWAMWEKLTFCLAGLLVIAFLAGICKNLWTARQRRRYYGKIAAEKLSGVTDTHYTVESTKVRDEEEVLFGIRALEKGVEVEGVWISRTNTPAPSEAGASFQSLTPPGGRSRSSSLDITSAIRPKIVVAHSRHGSHSSHDSSLPSTPHENKDSLRRSRGNSPARSSIFDRKRRSEYATTSTPSTPGLANFQQRTSTISATSYSRLSDSSLARSNTRDTLEILDINTMGTTTRQMYDNTRLVCTPNLTNQPRHSYASTVSSLGSNFIQKAEEDEFLQNPCGTVRGQDGDGYGQLDLLQSHRLSHVAETGQLTPRTKPRPNKNENDVNFADSLRPPHVYTCMDGTPSPERRPVLPLPTALPAVLVTPQRCESEKSTPGFKTHPNDCEGSSSEHMTITLPQSAHARVSDDRTTLQCDESGIANTQSANPPLALVTSRNSFSAYPRNLHVLRKVNSGFEILRPGTLGVLSLPLAESPNSGNRRRFKVHKKLQKKRRPAVEPLE